MKFLKLPAHIIKHSKLKICLCLLLMFVFFVLFFPYNELGDKAASQLSQATGGRVQLQYQHLNLHFFPPALSLQQPRLQAAGFAPLSMQELRVAPSLAQLLMFRPAASLEAQGLFQKASQKQGSLVQADWSMGSKIESTKVHELKLKLQRLALIELVQFLNLPIQPEAFVNLDMTLLVDPGLKVQPQAQLNLKVQDFHLPSLMITGLALPSLQLKQIQLAGRLDDNKFKISSATLGDDKDAINARIKGDVAVTIGAAGGRWKLTPGAYELFLKLNVKPAMAQDPTLGLALTFLKKFAKSTPQGTRYLLKLSGSNFRAPPRMAATPLF